MHKKLITVSSAAKMLGVSALTLRNWDKAGKLKAMRHPLNNYRVYNIDDVEKILKRMESGEPPIYIPKSPKGRKSSKSSHRTLNVKHLD
jgi:predicted site-specific integrase-resolvase